MKRHLVILATVVTLALPPGAGAETEKAASFDGTAAPAGHGWVDASELTHLLAEKGLLTPQELKELTHPNGAPSVEGKTMQEYFQTSPYRREGWRGGP
jgi:hypothetical protein